MIHHKKTTITLVILFLVSCNGAFYYPSKLTYSDPKEFDLERFIDYDLQFDKSFLQPCKNILDAIGWKAENISSLESFF